jgi:hypothetical protein
MINGQELMAASVADSASRSPPEFRPLAAVAGDD